MFVQISKWGSQNSVLLQCALVQNQLIVLGGDPGSLTLLSSSISWFETIAMPAYLLLLLFSFTFTHGQTASEDFDLGLIEVTHNPCPPTHDCVAQENCSHFQEDVAKLKSLSIESLEYEKLIEDLKESVCNKEERGFCCSTLETNVAVAPRGSKCCL